ncbi:AAA family ATPase [Cysteiniphilum sp. QT6929]|uniref:AAA family ATPase n=1 Tax=Cysteiniphilum sp. QT6929 TaxID=2975055 RepID=UPI0024B3C03C|nr:AAA family ATPase [Cysteiniphilum sp. QT6929]WHN65017.1 ATP-binding protein [Cysteiniphilum sp. QT6929]
MAKKIHIGSSNFGELITENSVFVDKSLFIKDIIEDTSKVILITRPRRFGKTLNMSMLHHFFAAKVDFTKTSGLFNQLAIAYEDDGAYIANYQGQYPVIFVSFKDIKARDYDAAHEQLSYLIREVYNAHYYLLESTYLNATDKNIFESYLELGKFSASKIDVSLRFLSHLLYKHYRQRVVILLDEYDTPLNAAYVENYIEEFTPLIRNLMSNTFKDNNALYKGVMTGILRVSKDSMLSGLNNLEVYTILDKEYRQYFGFSSEEVDALYQEQGLSDARDNAKKWYNGYKFGGLEIYNPWSILNCLHKKGKFDDFWIHTSNNQMIENLLLKFREDVHPALAQLMEHKTANVLVDRHVTYNTLNYQSSSLWSLLLFAGYLTTEQVATTDGLLYECQIRLPNIEIVHLLNYYFKFWLNTRMGVKYQSFLDNLVYGQVEAFSEQLNDYLTEALSVRDTGYTAEKFYHGLVLGLIASLRSTHIVHSNRETGFGFADVLLYPLASNHKNDIGIVMEFKHAKEDNSQDVEMLAVKALEQIEQKNYITELKAQAQVKRILLLGMAFNHKQVIVKSHWQIVR